MTPELEDKIANLPKLPGVYLMKGDDDRIFYVGKATELRSRVRQYFQGRDPRPFVQLLDRILVDIDFIVTRTPAEALILENTLIKRHRPRYNYMLRDDKNYASLRLDPRAPWPRVDIVRSRKNDGAMYFGPYASGQTPRLLQQLIHKHFQLRNCSDTTFRNRARPCLQYQIKRCPGPCVLPVDPQEYADNVAHVVLFLSGRSDELIRELEQRMGESAERMAYEEAAQLRDQIQAIRDSQAQQRQGAGIDADIHVVALHREGAAGMIVWAAFEHGRMANLETYPVTKNFVDSPDLLTEFVLQYYNERHRIPPPTLLLSEAPESLPDLHDALKTLRGRSVAIEVPQRGPKQKLVELALQNASLQLQQQNDDSLRIETALADLQKLARLRSLPRTMECFDISNFQGEEIVAAQVTFLDGQPDKSRYRRYRMQTVEGQDDFLSMHETLSRRIKRAKTGEDPLPDLLVIDGGSGQLRMACAALRAHGIEDQDIIALAESRIVGRAANDETVHSPERVFLPNVRDPIVLAKNTDVRLLLERLRNETHRFAITFHRERRDKARLQSGLDAIAGVGPARKAELLGHFGSLKGVKAASLSDLEALPGFPRKLAWAVYDHFHPGEADAPDA